MNVGAAGYGQSHRVEVQGMDSPKQRGQLAAESRNPVQEHDLSWFQGQVVRDDQHARSGQDGAPERPANGRPLPARLWVSGSGDPIPFTHVMCFRPARAALTVGQAPRPEGPPNYEPEVCGFRREIPCLPCHMLIARWSIPGGLDQHCGARSYRAARWKHGAGGPERAGAVAGAACRISQIAYV